MAAPYLTVAQVTVLVPVSRQVLGMNIDSSSPDEAVPSDTFHIYVLSFAYGALMVSTS